MRKISSVFPNWKVIFVLAVFLLATSNVFAQDEDLEGTLLQLSEDAAKGYIGPVISAFGSNMNGGWFRMAPPPIKFGLNLQFGLVGMGTYFPDELDVRTFSTTGDFRFNQTQARTIVTNTVGLSLPIQVEDALVDAISQTDFTVGMAGATIVGGTDPGDTIRISFSGGDITFIDPLTLLSRTETVDPSHSCPVLKQLIPMRLTLESEV
jgi:hypothetical protein